MAVAKIAKTEYTVEERPLAQSDWNAGARAQGRRGGSGDRAGDRAPLIKARGAVSREARPGRGQFCFFS